jgi:uncharacterized YigZ family protein|tara:strand:+ start:1938 stop:2540 length:603 start_codon:yes stop_codon:yes gene_type:complete
LLVVSIEGYSELIVNKSKFVGYSVIAPTKKDFLGRVNNFRNLHSNASHIVFAYQIKKNFIEPHFTDDGEPSGTAGKPLLNILESRQIINSGIVVARYYGGINLGTGGLARAYSQTGILSLSSSKLIKYIELIKYKLILKYNALETISNLIYIEKGIILDRVFAIDVTVIAKLTIATKNSILKKYPDVIINLLTDEKRIFT